MKKSINVIIIDDSQTCRASLQAMLTAEPDINVVACASDGLEGLELTQRLKPDLVTMDMFMPKMDGLMATRAIMEQCPTPILIISSPANQSESKLAFDALQAGALSVIEKTEQGLENNLNEMRHRIVNTVRTLANVQVFRRRVRSQSSVVPKFSTNRLGAEILALGTSTGGPEALHHILSPLPAHFPMPIVVTQHISQGFLPGLIHWLQNTTALKLEIAAHQQALRPGFVYFAPDHVHLLIKKGPTPIAILDDSPHINHFRPSITALFSSVAMSYPGIAIGGILTGMGSDGAAGLLKMKEAGCVTFAQSMATSAIYGMPGVAVELGAVDYSIDLEKIPQFLARLVGERRRAE